MKWCLFNNKIPALVCVILCRAFWTPCRPFWTHWPSMAGQDLTLSWIYRGAVRYRGTLLPLHLQRLEVTIPWCHPPCSIRAMFRMGRRWGTDTNFHPMQSAYCLKVILAIPKYFLEGFPSTLCFRVPYKTFKDSFRRTRPKGVQFDIQVIKSNMTSQGNKIKM